jgi:hypothetical protein
MVAGEEELYRRVPKTAGAADCYKVDADGKIRFTVAAFLDRAKRPSVDRAALRGDNPHLTRQSKDDGIASLIAGAVRAIGVIEKRDERGKVVSEHTVDVVAAPVDGNEAHAEIILSPTVGGKAFERLKEALARLATERGWRVVPGADLPAP